MAQNFARGALQMPQRAALQLPLFLVPTFASTSIPIPKSASALRSYASQVEPSENQPNPKFKLSTKVRNRDKNKTRGVSVIRSTGPRKTLSISRYPLPRPVLDPERRKDFSTNPNHGLWGFFYEDKNAMRQPEDQVRFGRSWTYQELSVKSFADLHRLYWSCHKEVNRIATNRKERGRVHAGYGTFEDDAREETVLETIKEIRQVLIDRYTSVQEARRILSAAELKELDLDEDSNMEGGWEHYGEEVAETVSKKATV